MQGKGALGADGDTGHTARAFAVVNLSNFIDRNRVWLACFYANTAAGTLILVNNRDHDR
jgi:hypothetical protein